MTKKENGYPRIGSRCRPAEILLTLTGFGAQGVLFCLLAGQRKESGLALCEIASKKNCGSVCVYRKFRREFVCILMVLPSCSVSWYFSIR